MEKFGEKNGAGFNFKKTNMGGLVVYLKQRKTTTEATQSSPIQLRTWKVCKKIEIPHLKGLCIQDSIKRLVDFKESAIKKFYANKNSGTHWLAYTKNGDNVRYFDSFGNFKLPRELMKHFGDEVNIIFYN